MQHLFDQRVAIHILNLGLIDGSPTGKLIFTIFSAFAQFERDLILTRTQEGKAYARRHNPHFREGRKETYSDMKFCVAYQQHQMVLSYQSPKKQVLVPRLKNGASKNSDRPSKNTESPAQLHKRCCKHIFLLIYLKLVLQLPIQRIMVMLAR